MLYAVFAVAALVGLVVLLFNLNVIVRVQYDDTEQVLRCTAHYLFINYVLAPAEESSKYKREEKRLKKGKDLNWDDEITLQGLYEDKGLIGFLKTLKITIENTWNLLMSFLRRATLRKLQIKLNIVGEDAADTAIIYGWANSIVYPIVGAILENVEGYKDYEVDIKPDYSEGADSSVELNAVASIKLWKLVGVLVESGVEAENLLLVLSKNPKHSKENVK